MTRILVIDDDQSVRTTIEIILTGEGFEVVLADDGRGGVGVLAASAFDAVIVDVFMPRMDGFEVIREIRSLQPSVPILAISGHASRDRRFPAPDFLSMAAALGATNCLQKPFRPRDLLDAVESCLAHSIRVPKGKAAKTAGVAGGPRK